MTVSLYLHVPYCEAKCDYCDFYSVPLDKMPERKRRVNRYIDVLLEETFRRFGELEREGYQFSVPSVYVGGGTPSLLGADGVSRILAALAPLITKSGSPAKPPCEITVEANPESADNAFLQACADHGVTRLSLGVQSFSAAVRAATGRNSGGTSLIISRLKTAAKLFGRGLSIDLMAGLPCQTETELCADIEYALAFGPGHISLYALTMEEGTPLAARQKTGNLAAILPSRDEADKLWLAGKDALLRAGYEQYEVSNFALEGFRCLHNIRYWRMENWIGAGPAASGTIIHNNGTGLRVNYRPDAAAFMENPAKTMIREELDKQTLLRETLLMGFRYTEGPDPDLFHERFGRPIEKIIPRTLARRKPFLKPNTTALTGTGLLFLNRFLADAFAELDGETSF
jgi:oxygen-independent coproporphyrinogen-3 oxidase